MPRIWIDRDGQHGDIPSKNPAFWLTTTNGTNLITLGTTSIIFPHRGTLLLYVRMLKSQAFLADYQQWHESEWIGWDIIPKWLTVYHCPNPIGLGRTSPQKKTSHYDSPLLLGPVGLEPTTNELWVRCSDRWAMDPVAYLVTTFLLMLTPLSLSFLKANAAYSRQSLRI